MVNIEYIDNLGLINKEDITLYIDLSELSTEDNTCKINYECKISNRTNKYRIRIKYW